MTDSGGEPMRVLLYSFSYLTLPVHAPAPNGPLVPNLPSPPLGGGIVMDCRVLTNPGRDPEFRSVDGRDSRVRSFLTEQDGNQVFVQVAYEFVRQSLLLARAKGRVEFAIGCGCTGGQHRSVWVAERLGERLKTDEVVAPVLTEIVHLQCDKGHLPYGFAVRVEPTP